MKRYNIKADYAVTGYGTHEEESISGEWVKYDDVKKEIERLEDENQCLVDDIEETYAKGDI